MAVLIFLTCALVNVPFMFSKSRPVAIAAATAFGFAMGAMVFRLKAVYTRGY